MFDIWEGTVVCHRKALSHISHSRCQELHKEPSMCGSCSNHNHVINLIAIERRRVMERKDECKKLASRRAS